MKIILLIVSFLCLTSWSVLGQDTLQVIYLQETQDRKPIKLPAFVWEPFFEFCAITQSSVINELVAPKIIFDSIQFPKMLKVSKLSIQGMFHHPICKDQPKSDACFSWFNPLLVEYRKKDRTYKYWFKMEQFVEHRKQVIAANDNPLVGLTPKTLFYSKDHFPNHAVEAVLTETKKFIRTNFENAPTVALVNTSNKKQSIREAPKLKTTESLSLYGDTQLGKAYIVNDYSGLILKEIDLFKFAKEKSKKVVDTLTVIYCKDTLENGVFPKRVQHDLLNSVTALQLPLVIKSQIVTKEAFDTLRGNNLLKVSSTWIRTFRQNQHCSPPYHSNPNCFTGNLFIQFEYQKNGKKFTYLPGWRRGKQNYTDSFFEHQRQLAQAKHLSPLATLNPSTVYYAEVHLPTTYIENLLLKEVKKFVLDSISKYSTIDIVEKYNNKKNSQRKEALHPKEILWLCSDFKDFLLVDGQTGLIVKRFDFQQFAQKEQEAINKLQKDAQDILTIMQCESRGVENFYTKKVQSEFQKRAEDFKAITQTKSIREQEASKAIFDTIRMNNTIKVKGFWTKLTRRHGNCGISYSSSYCKHWELILLLELQRNNTTFKYWLEDSKLPMCINRLLEHQKQVNASKDFSPFTDLQPTVLLYDEFGNTDLEALLADSKQFVAKTLSQQIPTVYPLKKALEEKIVDNERIGLHLYANNGKALLVEMNTGLLLKEFDLSEFEKKQ